MLGRQVKTRQKPGPGKSLKELLQTWKTTRRQYLSFEYENCDYRNWFKGSHSKKAEYAKGPV